MERTARLLVENWTVDYGEGHVENVCLPHAWQQDVPVSFEGSVKYRAEIEVPRKPCFLRFHGVSYLAEVFIDGNLVATHRGIWDAFDVLLDQHKGKRIVVEVSVVKNGGATFPVKDVASGFLPYVFHTFGGIYREVEILESNGSAPYARARVEVSGDEILLDGRRFYPRGLLNWGWYPEVGHPNPPDDAIRAEVLAAKALGFNLIKFCLWVPSHRYLEILREEGMEAWLELPLWNPSPEPEKLEAIADEIERIVRQYRYHDNVVLWTIGCELSKSTPPEYRARLVQLVKNLTCSPLVKDNSGGAEMYGGDLREFGDFDDFHPYCDLPFYPVVLDSLAPQTGPPHPVLLGEFNDFDVHRDLMRVADAMPFWASRMPELNEQSSRWQYDLPEVAASNRFALEPGKSGHKALMESSRQMALFVRKVAIEATRSRSAISGFVITGLRDTPISSSGFFDDWGDARFSSAECQPWLGEEILFQIPSRRPPWLNGGNRPGWVDPFNHFVGQIFLRIGIHSYANPPAGLIWTISDSAGRVAQGACPRAEGWNPHEVGQISWQCDQPGEFTLRVEFGNSANEWPLNVFSNDPVDSAGIEFRTAEGTLPMPFWREAAYQFTADAWGLANRWDRLLPISPDCALDPSTLPDHEVIINRIDTRTYAEHPIAVRAGDRIITTLRPWGGLGVQPTVNPSGTELLRRMKA